MGKILTESEQDKLNGIFAECCAKVETLPEHWIGGHDEGLSYCPKCAENKLAELMAAKPDEEYEVDGGWGIEGDGLATCETCCVVLRNSYTQYACEENVRRFEEHGFDPTSPLHCFEMEAVISSSGWGHLVFEYDAEWKRKALAEYYVRLHALGKSILHKLT